MIRRFLGIFWIGIVAVILAPLIVMQVVFSTFFSRDYVERNLVPASYGSVTQMFAESFAHKPQDAVLFGQRIRTMIPLSEYTPLVTLISDQWFDMLQGQKPLRGDFVVDFYRFKEALSKKLPTLVDRLGPCDATDASDPTFRFCKPTALSTNDPEGKASAVVVDVIQKEIPPRISITSTIADPMNTILIVKEYVPTAIAVIGTLGGLILMLIVGITNAPRRMRYAGAFLLAIGVMMGLMVWSFIKFPEIIPIFQGLTPGQVQLITLLASEVLQPVAIIAGAIAFAGCSDLILSKVIYRSNPTQNEL